MKNYKLINIIANIYANHYHSTHVRDLLITGFENYTMNLSSFDEEKQVLNFLGLLYSNLNLSINWQESINTCTIKNRPKRSIYSHAVEHILQFHGTVDALQIATALSLIEPLKKPTFTRGIAGVANALGKSYSDISLSRKTLSSYLAYTKEIPVQQRHNKTVIKQFLNDLGNELGVDVKAGDHEADIDTIFNPDKVPQERIHHGLDKLRKN